MFGRKSFQVRISACPRRDIAKDEERLFLSCDKRRGKRRSRSAFESGSEDSSSENGERYSGYLLFGVYYKLTKLSSVDRR